MIHQTQIKRIIFLALLFCAGLASIWYTSLRVESKEELLKDEKTTTSSVLSQEGAKEQDDTAIHSFDLFFNREFLNIRNTLHAAEKVIVSQQERVDFNRGLIPPQNVVFTDINDGMAVTITWDAFQTPPQAVKILRASTASGEETKIGEAIGTIHGFHDTDIRVGDVYYYRLISLGFYGEESEGSGPYRVGPIKDIIAPAPPEGVVVEGEDNAVRIRWHDPKDADVQFVNVYRSTKKGKVGKNIAQVEAGIEVFLDENVQDKNTYYYLLTSEDKVGNETPYNLVDTRLGNPNPFSPLF